MKEDTNYKLINNLPEEYYLDTERIIFILNKQYELSSMQISRIDNSMIYVFYDSLNNIYVVKDINNDIKNYFEEIVVFSEN